MIKDLRFLDNNGLTNGQFRKTITSFTDKKLQISNKIVGGISLMDSCSSGIWNQNRLSVKCPLFLANPCF